MSNNHHKKWHFVESLLPVNEETQEKEYPEELQRYILEYQNYFHKYCRLSFSNNGESHAYYYMMCHRGDPIVPLQHHMTEEEISFFSEHYQEKKTEIDTYKNVHKVPMQAGKYLMIENTPKSFVMIPLWVKNTRDLIIKVLEERKIP